MIFLTIWSRSCAGHTDWPAPIHHHAHRVSPCCAQKTARPSHSRGIFKQSRDPSLPPSPPPNPPSTAGRFVRWPMLYFLRNRISGFGIIGPSFKYVGTVSTCMYMYVKQTRYKVFSTSFVYFQRCCGSKMTTNRNNAQLKKQYC